MALRDGRRAFARYANHGNRFLYCYEERRNVQLPVLLELEPGTFAVFDHDSKREITEWAVAAARVELQRQRVRRWGRDLGLEGLSERA